MKKNLRLKTAFFVVVLLISLCACSGGSGQSETSAPPSASPDNTSTPAAQTDDAADPSAPVSVSGEVVISFDYEKISGPASNQWAVWIEDMDGGIIKTLYATKWTAQGGYKTRPDSIALWVDKSGLASMQKSEVDAISGATPKAGAQSYTWDLTDANGDTVLPGEYKFFVEGTLRWKNYVLYSGVVEISDNPVTIQADAEYFYEGSGNQPTLTDASAENKMIGPVTVRFVPTA